MAILARRGNAAEPASLLGELKLINSLNKSVNTLNKDINSLRKKGVNELTITQNQKADKNVNSLENKPVNDLSHSNRERIEKLVHKWELKAAETSSSSPRWYFARKILAELQEVLAEGNR